MSALGLTVVDPIVLAVIFISAAYATYKGFVSETLSIFAWAAAAFATLFFGPKLSPVTRGLAGTPWLGVLIGYALIFLIVLIPLSFMSFRFAGSVKNSPVGTLDRVLGAVFGIVRGLAIVGLAYIAFTYVVSVKSQPDWVARAWTLPIVKGSSEVLLSLVPDQHLGVAREELVPQQQPKTVNAPVPVPKPEQSAAPKKPHRKAYGAKERSELDRLIEQTGGSGNP
ncbi:MAG TPA: CvpA family protein [Rhizomicrobium sp.]|nr:CvpA family protein [Rhizomicrobium sp.]